VTNPAPPDPARLRVGFIPGVTLTKWRTVWRERLPRVPLEVAEVAVADQRLFMDADVVDLCFVRLPVDAAGLHIIRLYEEAPVVWVSRDHPLADFDEVTDADLAGEHVLPTADPRGIDLVARAEAVLRVPMSIARTFSRRDLVYRPVTDAESTTVALAWRADQPHPLTDEFVGIVRGRTANSARTTRERTAQERTAQERAAQERSDGRTSGERARPPAPSPRSTGERRPGPRAGRGRRRPSR